MLPKWHLILTAIFCFILHFLGFSLQDILIVLVAGVFIDIDHYFAYVIIKKDLSIKRAYQYSLDLEKKLKKGIKVKVPICIFHTIEFLIILIILTISNRIFVPLLVAVLFHLLIDFIDGFFKDTMQFSKHSVIYSILSKQV